MAFKLTLRTPATLEGKSGSGQMRAAGGEAQSAAPPWALVAQRLQECGGLVDSVKGRQES